MASDEGLGEVGMDFILVIAAELAEAARWADALITIATHFSSRSGTSWLDPDSCNHCGTPFVDCCPAECPGLIARQALGVA